MAFSATIAILVAIVVSIIDRDEPITFGQAFEGSRSRRQGHHYRRRCLLHGGRHRRLHHRDRPCLQDDLCAVVSISNQVTVMDPTMVALFLTMICCIILGMGVPTTANYCIMASTCAPILITMGVPQDRGALLRVLLRHRRRLTPPPPRPAPQPRPPPGAATGGRPQPPHPRERGAVLVPVHLLQEPPDVASSMCPRCR